MEQSVTTTFANTITIGRVMKDASKRASLESKVKALIIETFQYAGQSVAVTDYALITGYYLDDLAREFPYLDTDEIRIIFRNGVRGLYGEYFGLNARTFYQWTSAYIGSDDYVNRRAKKAAETPKALPPRDNDRYMKESINKDYASWLQLSEGAETTEAPQPGSLGAELRKEFAGEPGYRHSFGHPLCDLHNAKRNYCNRHGIMGELEDIFSRAKALGRTVIFKMTK